MQNAKEFLESEQKRLQSQARAIARKAEEEARTLTDEERVQVKGLVNDVNEIGVRIEQISENDRLMEALDAPMGEPTVAPTVAKSMGEAFVKSDGYRALKDRGMQGTWSTGPVSFGEKLTDGGSPALTVESITGASGTLPLQPQVAPMVGPVEEPLKVADLFAQGTATQNSIVYLEETTTQTLLGNQPYSGMSSLAKTTAEGTAKPAVYIDFTKRTTSIEKIAAFLPISDEMLEDEPQIASYINSRLSVFVRQAEEAYVMNKLLGSGVATADRSNLGIGSANVVFDQIAAGIYTIQTGAGLEPDGIVIHPLDFWKLATSKDATNGQYFSGGPYAAPARNPWGVRVVVTREAILGQPLVGAFREGATLWRKGGLSVEASNSHSDYFRKNLTALRAEERLGLTVLRPSAFAIVQE
jgi:HK97 family phage major capsid protein